MSPTRPSARPRRDAVSTRRSDARAAGCSPGSSPTRACRPRRAPNTTSTRTSPRPRASTGPGTTARSPPATCSWTRPSACPPTMRTPTPHTSAARTRTATGASAATCPREPASTTSRTRTCRPSSGRSTAPHEGPGLGNAQRGLVPRARQGNVEDKPPKDERCTYKLNPGIRLFFTRARITSSKPPK